MEEDRIAYLANIPHSLPHSSHLVSSQSESKLGSCKLVQNLLCDVSLATL